MAVSCPCPSSLDPATRLFSACPTGNLSTRPFVQSRGGTERREQRDSWRRRAPQRGRLSAVQGFWRYPSRIESFRKEFSVVLPRLCIEMQLLERPMENPNGVQYRQGIALLALRWPSIFHRL